MIEFKSEELVLDWINTNYHDFITYVQDNAEDLYSLYLVSFLL